MSTLPPKTILITGATSGFGKETAKTGGEISGRMSTERDEY